MTPRTYKRSLHARIWLSFLLFGTGLAGLVVAGANWALEDIEQQIVDRGLADELQHYRELRAEHPQAPLPSGANLQGYRLRDGDVQKLPAYLHGLAVGSHEISVDGRTYYAHVGTLGKEVVYLVRDATLFEEREKMIAHTLWAMVAVAAAMSFALGYWLSRKVMAPVSSLAAQVASLAPDTRASHLADQFARDEVGELADAFDRYHDRLTEFVEREQEFTADASHELRTPLTVIKGAAELLVANQELPERSLRVVHRIERATREMSQVVEALLFLARDQGPTAAAQGEGCKVAEVAQALIEDHRYLWAPKALQVEVHIHEDFTLPVAPAVLSITLGNLLRNAIAYTPQGGVTVIVDNPQVIIRDTGPGVSPDDLPHVFERHYRGRAAKQGGSGLGLAIVQRVCARYGWQIGLVNRPQGGTEAVLTLAEHLH